MNDEIVSDDSCIKIIKDADGDDLGTWAQGDRFFLGALSCDIAIPLDARAAALLMSELCAWFARTPAQPAPQERPVAEMTREEIRAELKTIWSAADDTERLSDAAMDYSLDKIEDGVPLARGNAPRAHALADRLLQLARKAGAA